jgi:hypothetical protein
MTRADKLGFILPLARIQLNDGRQCVFVTWIWHRQVEYAQVLFPELGSVGLIPPSRLVTFQNVTAYGEVTPLDSDQE